ncbi:MAG: penicillin acylase family protein, partial [Alphaproteobacteria bacterium]
GSRHGPGLSDALPELAALVDAGHVIALRWTALDPDDTTMAAGRRLMTASGVEAAIAALRDFRVPMQNILLADATGAIAFIAPGRVPVRNDASATKGVVPARGWTGTDEWIGWVPYAALPRRVDPADGLLATANEKIVGSDYPYYLTRDWTPPYRADRIDQLLRAQARHDRDSFAAMQHDTVSLEVRALKDAMLRRGAFQGRHGALRAALADWDGAMDGALPQPLIYIAWVHAFAERLFADELGPLFARHRANKADFLYHVLTQETFDAWCDDVTTVAMREDCAEILARALDDAVAALAHEQGRDWRRWRWADVHRMVHQHQPMSDAPALAWLFELAMHQGGGPGAIDVAYPGLSTPRPFDSVIGPSYRAIYDLAQPDQSLYVIPTGQSGQPLSRHYRDLSRIWRAQGYVRIPTQWAAASEGALGRLTLRPAKEKDGQHGRTAGHR